MKTSDNGLAICVKCVCYALYGSALLLADAFEAALLSDKPWVTSATHTQRSE